MRLSATRTLFKSHVLILFLLTFSAAGWGQKIVTGQILDSQNDEPLAGATVHIKGTTYGNATDAEGYFKLKVPDTYSAAELIFRCIGFNEQIQKYSLNGNTNLGVIALSPSSFGLNEIKVLASFVDKEGEKPLVSSTLTAYDIETKLSNQEFPEILKSVPSVYVTKQGGGMGDARITLRGFSSENIGLLINGIPVNGMENGAVYWSNWAGLADVTQSIQVQRGLGISKLGIPSVGGTVNIITKSIDAEAGGSVYYGMGNDGYQKIAFNVSSGLMKNGWAFTLSGSHTKGDGYVTGTDFEGWSYFANLSKRLGDDHLLSFTAFGAPQWHNMRANKHFVEDYTNSKDGIRLNNDYGYINGKVQPTAGGYNEYHKPQLSLNHFWTINEKSSLSTSAYFSKSTGGGISTYGKSFGDRKMLQMDNTTGRPFEQTDNATGEVIKQTYVTPDGLIDYNRVMETNQAAVDGSKAIFVMGTNSHEWYGLLSSYTNNFTKALHFTAGIDVRYYKGYHYQKISDLLGGTYYKDYTSNKSGEIFPVLAYRDPQTELHKGDKVGYDNTSHILWSGGFTQLEFIQPSYNAFVSLSLTNHMYKRKDPGTYGIYSNQATAPVSMKVTDWTCFVPTTVKAGFNYKFGGIHNVFINGGYVTKAPTFDGVFASKKNDKTEDLKLEKITTVEIGYGLHTRNFGISLNGYYTKWMDKTYSYRPYNNTRYYSVPGTDALHKGIELEVTYRPVASLLLGGNFAIGDWKWTDDINYQEINDEGIATENTLNAYIKDLHVGNAPQTSAALYATWEPFPNLSIGANWNYFGRNYANFDITKRTDENDRADSWRMPDFCTVDMHLNYRFAIGKFNANLFGNVNNLFNNEYISDATDGKDHTKGTALVWYGFGTTWTAGLKVAF